MATSEWIEAATRQESKPVGAGFLADDHAYAGVTGGLDDADARAAEKFVRRVLSDTDEAAMSDVLQALGLRPTPRPKRRSDALTARPRQKRRRGLCPQCRQRIGLRADGTIGAHRSCLGEGQQPKEDR